MNKWLTAVILIGVAACSNRAVYENTRIHLRNQCIKEPPGRYEQCLERADKSYDEYKRERDAVRNTHP